MRKLRKPDWYTVDDFTEGMTVWFGPKDEQGRYPGTGKIVGFGHEDGVSVVLVNDGVHTHHVQVHDVLPI